MLASAGLHPDRLEELTDLEYSDEEGIQFDGARNAEGKKIDWIDLVEGELSDLTEAEDEAERPSCVEVGERLKSPCGNETMLAALRHARVIREPHRASCYP